MNLEPTAKVKELQQRLQQFMEEHIYPGERTYLEQIHAAEQFDPEQVERDLGSGGIRLYRYGTDNIAGQAPASFKNVRRVVEAMTAFNLIRPVIRLRPIAVLKG